MEDWLPDSEGEGLITHTHSEMLTPTRPHLLIVPFPGPRRYNLHIPLPGHHRLIQTYESMGAIPKHKITNYTFNPKSKVPRVYSSLSSVKSPKLKVSSEILPII